MPEVGDVVMINKSSDYGMVTDIVDEKAVVVKMSVEEVKEHFGGDDGEFKKAVDDIVEGYSGVS